MVEVELDLKQSVKVNRLLAFDDMRRLVRRENVLKKLQSVSFYGVHLNTTQKEAIFVVHLEKLNTYGVDELSQALAQNFDDYDIIPQAKCLLVEAKFFYGEHV